MALPPLTFCEFFAGIGLFRIGLEQAGWRAVWAQDICAKKARVYNNFFGGPLASELEVGDIARLQGARLPAATLATCSFPCTDISLAGRQKGLRAGRQSSVFFDFARALGEAQRARRAPLVVLLENVPALLAKADDFDAVVAAMRALGYEVSAFLLNALHFVPQSRKRLFVVAAPSRFFDAAGARLPDCLASAALRDALARNRCPVLDLPPPPPLLTGGLNALLEKLPATDPRWWGRERVAHHLALMPPRHRARLEPIARAFCNRGRRGKGGGSVPEVRQDDCAGTLRAGCGGNSQNFIAQAFPAYQRTKKTTQQTDIYPHDYHPAKLRDKSKRFIAFQVGQRRGKMTETRNSDTAAALGNSQARLSNVAAATLQGVCMRALTPREAGRLMGLPERYPIGGCTERQAVGFFGDGVVVPAVAWIARNALAPRLRRL